jgi:FLVCR family feline leukemia virus subgroup C receptor-related protein
MAPVDTELHRAESAHLINSKPIILYRYRWVITALFNILTFTNAAQWITFSPLSSTLELRYGVSTQAINWLSMIYMIIYIPFVFVSSWFISRFGLRYGILAGALLNALGALVRYLGDSNYTILLLGQVLLLLMFC